jgi:hypothetical protein
VQFGRAVPIPFILFENGGLRGVGGSRPSTRNEHATRRQVAQLFLEVSIRAFAVRPNSRGAHSVYGIGRRHNQRRFSIPFGQPS